MKHLILMEQLKDSFNDACLGCSITNELIFDKSIISNFANQANHLMTSPLLNANQKLNIMNKYLLPILTYPLQAAALNKIPKTILYTLDSIIRSTVKEITNLPISTPTNMIYSPEKYRGLAMVSCRWEVLLQHFSINKKLSALPDGLLHAVYDCQTEMEECRRVLGVIGDTARQLRKALREMAFTKWCALPNFGIGCKFFSHYPKVNSFVYDKNSLSISEWVQCMKMSFNYANLGGVPGSKYFEETKSDRCRHCPTTGQHARETISHVLGKCDFGNLLRNERHLRIKHYITDLLIKKGFVCFQEAFCYDIYGSDRRIDILAFDSRSNRAFIIDPTIQFENNEDHEAIVQQEKKDRYETCVQDLATRYSQFGRREYEVIGLWFGARGSIANQVVTFFDRFELDKAHLQTISESILILISCHATTPH